MNVLAAFSTDLNYFVFFIPPLENYKAGRRCGGSEREVWWLRKGGVVAQKGRCGSVGGVVVHWEGGWLNGMCDGSVGSVMAH